MKTIKDNWDDRRKWYWDFNKNKLNFVPTLSMMREGDIVFVIIESSVNGEQFFKCIECVVVKPLYEHTSSYYMKVRRTDNGKTYTYYIGERKITNNEFIDTVDLSRTAYTSSERRVYLTTDKNKFIDDKIAEIEYNIENWKTLIAASEHKKKMFEEMKQ